MKNIVSFLLLMCLSACNQDLDLLDEWRLNTIVFGILNPADSVQVLRISKAYHNPGLNALEIASTSLDSTFPAGAEVVLEGFDSQGNLQDTFSFFPILYANRDSGLFNYPFQYLYVQTRQKKLSIDHNYRLKISYPDASVPNVTGSTVLCGQFSILSPLRNNALGLNDDSTITLSHFLGANMACYRIEAVCTFQEISLLPPFDSVFVERKFFMTNDIFVAEPFRVTGQSFDYKLNLLVDGLFAGYNPQPDKKRILKDLKFVYWGAPASFFDYLLYERPDNVYGQVRPVYTNLDNGFGLFTSRSLTELPLRPIGPFYFEASLRHPKMNFRLF